MEIRPLFARASLLRRALVMGVLFSLGSQAESPRLVTGELPPYATRERPDDGVALDIVRRASIRT